MGRQLIRWREAFQLAFALVLLVALVFTCYRNWRELQKADAATERTQTLIGRVEAVLSSVTDAETAQRGYLLTGDERYLAPYEQTRRELPEELARLDESGLATQLDASSGELKRLALDKLAELKQTVDLRRAGDAAGAMAIVQSDRGQHLMEQIRGLANRLGADSYESLRRRSAASQERESRLLWVAAGGSVILFTFIVLASLSIARGVARRDELIDQLTESRGETEAGRQILEATLTSIGDAVIATDNQGHITFTNRVADKLTGWPALEAQGKSLDEVFRIVNESSRLVVENPAQKALREGVVVGLANHTVLIARDGSETPIDDSAAPIRNRAGAITGVVLVFRDVAERRRAEKALEDSEWRYRQMFEANPQPMWIVDRETTQFLAVNDAACVHYGYTRDEMLHQITLRDIRVPEEHAMLDAHLRMDHVGAPRSGPWRHRKKDGTQIYVEVTWHATEFNGRQARFAMIADTTQKVLAQEALRASERRFRQLADSLPQIVWTAGPDGVTDYFNGRWYEMTGRSEKSLENHDWGPAFHEADRDVFLKGWQASIASGEIYEGAHQLRDSRTGLFRWHLCRAVPVLDPAGKIAKWFGTCTDIDDQKRIEVALRRANEDLSQFAFSASHDLQEPLRNIAMFTQLLERKYGGKLEEGADEFIRMIVQSAHRMEQLIHDLLAYARTANFFERTDSFSDANVALGHALSDLRAVITETQAVVQSEPLPTLRVEDIHLRQLFQNLIGNSLKYRGPDPPRVEVSAKQARGEWVFTVADNGIGVDPQYSRQIFGLFKRLHNQDKYSGTGIGLALCQKIVERYGGRIWVESEPGHGARFSFTFPDET